MSDYKKEAYRWFQLCLCRIGVNVRFFIVITSAIRILILCVMDIRLRGGLSLAFRRTVCHVITSHTELETDRLAEHIASGEYRTKDSFLGAHSALFGSNKRPKVSAFAPMNGLSSNIRSLYNPRAPMRNSLSDPPLLSAHETSSRVNIDR